MLATALQLSAAARAAQLAAKVPAATLTKPAPEGVRTETVVAFRDWNGRLCTGVVQGRRQGRLRVQLVTGPGYYSRPAHTTARGHFNVMGETLVSVADLRVAA